MSGLRQFGSEVAGWVAELSAAEQGAEEAQERADEFASTLEVRTAEVSDLRGQVAAREQTIVQLRARILELETEGPDPEPDPDPDPDPEPEPTRVTRFGACPEMPGGESLAAAQRVTTKWGPQAAVRQFKANFSAPNRVGSIMHTSYKPNVTDLLAGRLEGQIETVVRGARDGDVVEVWHETDKKIRDGANVGGATASYDLLVRAKNYFYDKVKAINPKVLVANTITGWEFEPSRSGARARIDQWGAVKADVIGIDCDGIVPGSLPYTDYKGETAEAVAFVTRFASNGYKFYAVPEFGVPRVSQDASGVERAKNYAAIAKVWQDTGCLYSTLYEYDSTPNYSLSTQAELDQWRSLIR